MSTTYKIPLERIHKCYHGCSRILKVTNPDTETEKMELVPNPTYDTVTGHCSKHGSVESSMVIIANPNRLSNVLNLDEVVIQDKSIELEIDYPLRKSVRLPINSDTGITRKMLIDNICETYQMIYSVEEKTTKVPVGSHPVFQLNRNETDGEYGIWGHYIGDLVIERITYYPSEKLVRLNIGS